MSELSRRHILGLAAGAAAGAAMPAGSVAKAAPATPTIMEWAAANIELKPWPAPPFVDRQTFFDGEVDWTFYARRGEWTGVHHDPVRRAAMERQARRDSELGDPVMHPEGCEDPTEYA